MLEKIIFLAMIMFLPLIEIRLGIPLGILKVKMALPFGLTLSGFGLPPVLVFFLALLMGFITAVVVFNLLHIIDDPLRKSRFSARYFRMLDRMQRKIHPYVEKYGILGLGIYIFIPIPGTGVYAGSLGGYVLGFEKNQFYKAAMIGVFGEAILITALTLLGAAIF